MYPINDGAFRNLNIILPPGRVVSATKPAAMRWWMTIPMTVVDTILRALASAVPDRVAAGHHADLCVATIHGLSPRTGRFYVGSSGPLGGGWGAISTSDGMSGVVCINDGDNPQRDHRSARGQTPDHRRELCVAARFGRPGCVPRRARHRTARANRAPMRTGVHVERTKCAPWGLNGGLDALANRVNLERGDGTHFINANGNGKLDNELLRPATSCRSIAAAAGGTVTRANGRANA